VGVTDRLAPRVDRNVRTEIDAIQTGAARGDRERERPELVATAWWEPDHDRRAARIACRRIEVVRDAPSDRLARGMLVRDVELAPTPRVTDASQRREHDAVHRGLEALAGERVVERLVHRAKVEPAGGIDHRRYGFGDRWSPRRYRSDLATSPSRVELLELRTRRRPDAIGCLTRPPALVLDEALHRT